MSEASSEGCVMPASSEGCVMPACKQLSLRYFQLLVHLRQRCCLLASVTFFYSNLRLFFRHPEKQHAPMSWQHVTHMNCWISGVKGEQVPHGGQNRLSFIRVDTILMLVTCGFFYNFTIWTEIKVCFYDVKLYC
jgi:hypothetical protein